jgi:hypothetical protein
MKTTSVSDWDNEYARVARHASQLRSLGTTGTAGSSATSTGYAANSSSTGLNNRSSLDSDRRALTQNVQRLQRSLQTIPLTPSDLQRRLRLMNHLQQQLQQTQQQQKQAGQNQMSSNSNAQNALLQQDEMLDDLAHGVERLKHQSLLIGDEAKLHLNLLGDMENQVDIAQSGLEGETRRADGLRENSIAIWKLQMIVVALAIVLVMLILTGLT